jgi:hypothetical protein
MAESSGGSVNSFADLLSRLLNQIGFAALIPATAVSLVGAFIFSLRDTYVGGVSPDARLEYAFHELGTLDSGGWLLALAVTLFLAVLIQVLGSDALKLFEGSWGINRFSSSLADFRSKSHRRRLRRLIDLARHLRRAAFETAVPRLADELTDQQIQYLRAWILGGALPQLSVEDIERVKTLNWEHFTSPALRRRRRQVTMKLYDYPQEFDVGPTRFENLMLSFEGRLAAGQSTPLLLPVRNLDDEIRRRYDEQRIQMEMYAMLTLAWIALGVVAVVALGGVGAYLSGAVGLILGLLTAAVTYQSLLSCARKYGYLLTEAYESLEEQSRQQP